MLAANDRLPVNQGMIYIPMCIYFTMIFFWLSATFYPFVSMLVKVFCWYWVELCEVLVIMYAFVINQLGYEFTFACVDLSTKSTRVTCGAHHKL